MVGASSDGSEYDDAEWEPQEEPPVIPMSLAMVMPVKAGQLESMTESALKEDWSTPAATVEVTVPPVPYAVNVDSVDCVAPPVRTASPVNARCVSASSTKFDLSIIAIHAHRIAESSPRCSIVNRPSACHAAAVEASRRVRVYRAKCRAAEEQAAARVADERAQWKAFRASNSAMHQALGVAGMTSQQHLLAARRKETQRKREQDAANAAARWYKRAPPRRSAQPRDFDQVLRAHQEQRKAEKEREASARQARRAKLARVHEIAKRQISHQVGAFEQGSYIIRKQQRERVAASRDGDSGARDPHDQEAGASCEQPVDALIQNAAALKLADADCEAPSTSTEQGSESKIEGGAGSPIDVARDDQAAAPIGEQETNESTTAFDAANATEILNQPYPPVQPVDSEQPSAEQSEPCLRQGKANSID